MTRFRIVPVLAAALVAATGLSAQEILIVPDEGIVSDVIGAESSATDAPDWHGCTHDTWGQPDGAGAGIENQHTMEYTHVLVPGPAISELGVEEGAICGYIADTYLESRAQVCAGSVMLGEARDDVSWSVYLPQSSRLIAMSCG